MKNILSNSVWMILEKIVQMIFGVFVGIWVARYLGPGDFGVFSYSIAFVGFFLPFTSLGLNHILTRDLVLERQNEFEILGTAWTLRAVSGFLAIALSLLVVYFLRGNERSVVLFVGLLSLGQAFKAFLVIDFWYQSNVRSKFVVISRVIGLAISNALKILVIVTGQNLELFVVVMFVEYSLPQFLLAITYRAQGQKLRNWVFNTSRAVSYLRQGWPLILSGFAAQLYLRIDVVMIGEVLTDTDVGLYSAAARLSEIWYVIPASVVSSMFPKILRLRKESKNSYGRRLQQIYSLLAFSGYSIALVVSVTAPFLIQLLFGEDYSRSVPVLLVHIWAGVFIFMRILFSKWIISEGKFYLSILTQGGGALLNIVLNILLIPRLGIIGAAWATLISYAGASYGILFFNRDTWVTARMMTRALFFPLTMWNDFNLRRNNESNS